MIQDATFYFFDVHESVKICINKDDGWIRINIGELTDESTRFQQLIFENIYLHSILFNFCSEERYYLKFLLVCLEESMMISEKNICFIFHEK